MRAGEPNDRPNEKADETAAAAAGAGALPGRACALRGGRNPMPRRACRRDRPVGPRKASSRPHGRERSRPTARDPPGGPHREDRATRPGRIGLAPASAWPARREAAPPGRRADSTRTNRNDRIKRTDERPTAVERGRGRAAGRGRRSERPGFGMGDRGFVRRAAAGGAPRKRRFPVPGPVPVSCAPLLRAPARAPASRRPSPCTGRWRR